MQTWQRAYIAACVSALGGAICYVLCDYGAWPKLMYLPYDRQWLFARELPDSSAAVYLGMVLWGGLGAVACGGAGWLVSGRFHRLPPAFIPLVAGWTIAGVAFAASYYLWSLWPF